jgi:hypothetical protein
MNLDPSIDQLLSEAVQAVPEELRQDVRNWIGRAQSGELTEVTRELQRETDEALQAFDEAVKQVEQKLQE